MPELKPTYNISARKVQQLTGYPVESMEDVYAAEKLGIHFTRSALDGIAKGYGSAMDSNFVSPLSTPSLGSPIQFLQTFLPGQVAVLTNALMADKLVGISIVGSWEDESIIQAYMERTGNANVYQDNTNIPLTGYNVNFERRSIVRFEIGMKVNRLEELRGSRINFSVADTKRVQSAIALEVKRNYIAFYGYNSGVGRTYGILNDPGLPAIINLPNGASGSSEFSKKTTLEIIADFQTAMQALVNSSGANIDPYDTPITVAIPSAVFTRLSTATEFGYSVKQWLNETYPNARFVQAPELNGANGGQNVFYVYADEFLGASTDDGKVFMQMVPSKMVVTGAQQLMKGYEESYSNATAGVMLKRPFAVVRCSGC